MRAICATPASPLGENDFSRNQTGKLGKNGPFRAFLAAAGNARDLRTHVRDGATVATSAPLPTAARPVVL